MSQNGKRRFSFREDSTMVHCAKVFYKSWPLLILIGEGDSVYNPGSQQSFLLWNDGSFLLWAEGNSAMNMIKKKKEWRYEHAEKTHKLTELPEWKNETPSLKGQVGLMKAQKLTLQSIFKDSFQCNAKLTWKPKTLLAQERMLGWPPVQPAVNFQAISSLKMLCFELF